MQSCTFSRRVTKLNGNFEDFCEQSTTDCNFGSRSGIEKEALLLCFHMIWNVCMCACCARWQARLQWASLISVADSELARSLAEPQAGPFTALRC